MRWQGRRGSENVEDRRGRPAGGIALGGGGLILVVVLALLFGVNPLQLLNQVGGPPAAGPQQPLNPQQKQAGEFVAVVLADTEDVWNEQFRRLGRQYKEPKLVLFTDRVQSACGLANSAVGPFYCPGDEQVYIDLTFFDEMSRRFGAAGDFAQAYVIAHEVGHHVQNLLGTSDRIQAERRRAGEREANQLSVRLELQADFLAGVWAHHAHRMKNILEPGDIDEALNAANAIGDDRLQKQGRGYVVPDSFTHGTSEQRKRWFRKGFESGDIAQGDTFGMPYGDL